MTSEIPYGVTLRGTGVSRWRLFRAYGTMLVVVSSYTWLRFLSRIFGEGYREKRIKELHTRNARRVYASIIKLQGLFIKVGQLLSIMANFIPEEFRVELQALQDKVPPRPFAEVEETLRAEFGQLIPDQFVSFERVPIASASLGQVHEARLPDGRHVVVKIQHRDIDRIVRLDLHIIRRIMAAVQWLVPVQGLDGYYHQIKELVSQELDFTLEAENVERISHNFGEERDIVFPVPIRELSTRRALTSSFVEGKKIGDLEALEAMGIDRKALARRLLRAYCKMIFVDGVYHADPHPGNILVQRDGTLVLLDFGAVAELSPQMREGIAEFLEGMLRRDTDRLIKALRKMGFLSRTHDEIVSEKVVEYFHQRFQDEIKLESFNLKDIKVDPQRGLENLLDLRKMDIGLKELSSVFVVPKDWVLLERTILLLFGCCALLDSELNPLDVIRPYLNDFVFGTRDWKQIAVESAKDLALSAVMLPEEVRKYITRATRGELEFRIRGLEEGTRTLYTSVRQLIYTVIGVAGAFAGLDAHHRGDGPIMTVSLGIAGVAALFLLVSSVMRRPKS